MPFFNRRTAPADANTSSSVTGTREKHSRGNIMSSMDRRHKDKHTNTSYGTNAMYKRPSFGRWIKATGLDIVTMIIMGAIGLGVGPLYSYTSEGPFLISARRSTKLLQHRHEVSQSTLPTETSSILTSPTLCAKRSFPSGRLHCLPRSSRYSSFSSCRSAFAAFGT